jgi:hypothetical protein
VQAGSLLFLSGMLPTEGSEARYIGRIGAELDNLVLFLAGRTEDRADSPVLSALAKRYGEIAETDSEVVVVVAESVAQADEFKRKMHFPVSVLSDTDMRVHNMVGASGRSSLPTGFWRCLPYGALAPGTVYLTFRMFSPGCLIWTVSVLNARKSNAQPTIEPRQT